MLFLWSASARLLAKMELGSLKDPKIQSEVTKLSVASRRLRADFKQSLRSGATDPVSGVNRAIADKDGLGKIKVSQFLRSFRGIGPKKTAKALEQLGIDKSRRLAGLGSVQAQALERYLTMRLI